MPHGSGNLPAEMDHIVRLVDGAIGQPFVGAMTYRTQQYLQVSKSVIRNGPQRKVTQFAVEAVRARLGHKLLLLIQRKPSFKWLVGNLTFRLRFAAPPLRLPSIQPWRSSMAE